MENLGNESGEALEEGEFELQLRHLIADAHAEGTQVEGAYVIDASDGSEWEVLITSVQR